MQHRDVSGHSLDFVEDDETKTKRFALRQQPCEELLTGCLAERLNRAPTMVHHEPATVADERSQRSARPSHASGPSFKQAEVRV